MTNKHATDTTSRAGRAPDWILLARDLATLAALLAVVAFGLRVLDQVPAMAAGVARGARRADSVAALERQISHRLPIPSYFPDTLAWPPDDLLSFAGTSASISFRHRPAGDTWLIVAMAVGRNAVAPQILPSVTPLQSEATMVRSIPATVERLRDADGVVWHQLTWHAQATALLVRYRGTLDEAMLIANSLDERGR